MLSFSFKGRAEARERGQSFAAEGASRPGFRASALTLFTKAELKLGAGTKLRGQGLELAELDHGGDALDDGVFAVFVGVVGGLEVDAEEAAEGLPEAGSEAAEEGFEDVVARLVGLAVDELDEHLGLAFGEFIEDGFVLFEDGSFHFFEVFFAFFLRWEGLDVFVGLDEGLADEFGVGEGLAYVADCLPVELFFFFVFEF